MVLVCYFAFEDDSIMRSHFTTPPYFDDALGIGLSTVEFMALMRVGDTSLSLCL